MQQSNYETDFVSWSAEQADLLKKGQFEKLDMINLIDEVESLGRSEKRTVTSYLTIYLMHLLKSRYQPNHNCRSWEISLRNSLKQFLKNISANPGLKPSLDEIILDAYENAIEEAAKETGFSEDIFPSECPWIKEIHVFVRGAK